MITMAQTNTIGRFGHAHSSSVAMLVLSVQFPRNAMLIFSVSFPIVCAILAQVPC